MTVCKQGPAVCKPLLAFREVGIWESLAGTEKLTEVRLQLQSAKFTVETDGASNGKWSRWEIGSFAELRGVRVFRRPLVCLAFWQLEQLMPWLLSLVLPRLSQNSWTCRASAIDQRPESKGGHLSRVGTRRPVSRRKCSTNHRLSTDHKLRSTTS